MSTSREIEAAARAYEAFHGEDPRWLDRIELADVGFRVGTLYNVTYGVVESAREVLYHHEFQRPPCLATSYDGRIALVLAGEWRFTRRGFVG